MIDHSVSPTQTRCPGCNGRGTRTKTYDDYGLADPKDVTCWACHGVGYVVPAEPRDLRRESRNGQVDDGPAVEVIP